MNIFVVHTGIYNSSLYFVGILIQGFVAERKIDEELAQTKRFVCDEDNLLQVIWFVVCPTICTI
jgi:hypothetical protein